jgi:hypothetical protein
MLDEYDCTVTDGGNDLTDTIKRNAAKLYPDDL